jgi:hypothetical protein
LTEKKNMALTVFLSAESLQEAIRVAVKDNRNSLRISVVVNNSVISSIPKVGHESDINAIEDMASDMWIAASEIVFDLDDQGQKKCIGSGAFGTVVLAKRYGDPVCVKVLMTGHGQDLSGPKFANNNTIITSVIYYLFLSGWALGARSAARIAVQPRATNRIVSLAGSFVRFWCE